MVYSIYEEANHIMDRGNGLVFHLPFITFVIIIIVHVAICLVYNLIHLLPLALFPISIILMYFAILLRRKRR